jgi:UDP-glucose 4-epimerase
MSDDRLSDLAGSFDEYEGSIDSREALRDVLRACEARMVVSCAAHGVGRLGLMRSGEAEADAAMAVNVMGLNKLLDSAREASVRRTVWMSSTVVYGPSELYPSQPVGEDDLPAPKTFYGLTKVLAEEVARYHVRRHRVGAVGLRLPLIMGPGLWYEGAAAALASMFDAARTGTPHQMSFHDEPIDLMHVNDVAAAVLTVLRHDGPLSPIYNLEGFKARPSDLVAELRRLRPGIRFEIERTSPPVLFPLVSGARLRSDVGFSARHDLPTFTRSMLEARSDP